MAQQMDPTLASCILDLVFREPSVGDPTAFQLLRALPAPAPAAHLREPFLLRLLRSDLSLSSISARRTLASLHHLRRLRHSEPPASLLSACSHVARHCSLPPGSPTYEESEAAALRSLREYVEEAWAEMGPSLLEVKAREYLERERNEPKDEERKRRREDASCEEAEGRELDDFECAEASCSELVRLDRDRARRALERGVGDGVADVGGRAAALAIGADKQKQLGTPEVLKVKEARQKNCSNLHTVVEDSLAADDAVAVEVLLSLKTLAAEKLEHGGNNAVDNARSSHKSIDKINVDRVAEARPGVTIGENSLSNTMDRIPSAHTSELLSVDSPQDSLGSANGECSNLRRSASSLKLQYATKSTKRRKRRNWSSHEEKTLEKAVKKHGEGNWKFILSCYHSDFIERTEVDLKDKWRNMRRHL